MTEADIFSLGLHEVRELFEKRSNLIRFFKESIGDYIDSARAAKRKKNCWWHLYQTCLFLNTPSFLLSLLIHFCQVLVIPLTPAHIFFITCSKELIGSSLIYLLHLTFFKSITLTNSMSCFLCHSYQTNFLDQSLVLCTSSRAQDMLLEHGLVAQTVKNLPAMWETWVQSLDWEGLLEKGMTVFLPGQFHGQRSLTSHSPWGHRVRHN